MKFLKGFLVFILITIILGGIGYVGYSFLFMNHSGHSTTASQTTQTGQSTDSSKGSTQDQQSNNQQSGNNQTGLNQASVALQNKDNLSKSISTLNEALRLMSVDPYAPGSNSSGNPGNTGTQQGMAQGSNQNGSTTPAATQGNNTTINIYPQGGGIANAQQSNMTQNTGMQNMGTTYDANKMEQLHAGLYKISVGMALLNQLNNELVSQAESASINTQNAVQYYSNQYYLTVQNKNKLNQALNYINEAANFVNINPYVSSNGLVYDKDRMNQLHQSVFKLAEGVASLNLLSDDFTKQSVSLSNTVQNYINNANNANNNMNMPQMNMSTGLFGGLFDNISVSSIVNIVLILFVIGLIFGIFGFIFSLFKPKDQNAATKENGII